MGGGDTCFWEEGIWEKFTNMTGKKGMLTVILQLVKGRVGIKNCDAGVHRGEPVMWK